VVSEENVRGLDKHTGGLLHEGTSRTEEKKWALLEKTASIADRLAEQNPPA